MHATTTVFHRSIFAWFTGSSLCTTSFSCMGLFWHLHLHRLPSMYFEHEKKHPVKSALDYITCLLVKSIKYSLYRFEASNSNSVNLSISPFSIDSESNISVFLTI